VLREVLTLSEHLVGKLEPEDIVAEVLKGLDVLAFDLAAWVLDTRVGNLSLGFGTATSEDSDSDFILLDGLLLNTATSGDDVGFLSGGSVGRL
jgi:hypothetical protein